MTSYNSIIKIASMWNLFLLNVTQFFLALLNVTQRNLFLILIYIFQSMY
nr:MAG TPA: hypothetical protein [Caudoviricetes sp.]